MNYTHNDLRHLSSHIPYLAMDLDSVASTFTEFEKSLPKVKVFYAVKCNPDKLVLETLCKAGSYFEVASYGELKRLIEAGVDPTEVIYSNPVKPANHIKKTYEKGVRDYSFDNSEELQKISDNAPKAAVHLRLQVSNSGSLIDLSNKFGTTSDYALSLATEAQKLNLHLRGITFHVGSQAENVDSWEAAFSEVADVMGQLDSEGHRVEVVNMGGGFPICYGHDVPSIQTIGQKVQQAAKLLPYSVELWAEPGRFLVGESGVIAAHVIGKTNRGGESWIYLDVGRFQAFVEMFESEDLQYPVFTSVDDVATNKIPYTITGPSCDSYDTIMRGVELPENLSVGDTVYFASAGAYTTVYGSDFNDFAAPKVITMKDSSYLKERKG